MKRLALLAFSALSLTTAASAQGGSEAVVDQVGAHNGSTITQNGTSNEARTYQYSVMAGSSADANTAQISQDGTNLNAAGSEITELLNLDTYLSPYYTGTGVTPGIIQIGEGNTGTIIQTGNWNSALQLAVGADNDVAITQNGGASNAAGAVVIGVDNEVDITQSGSSPGDFNNVAVAGVLGEGNHVMIDQSNSGGFDINNVALFGAVGLDPDVTNPDANMTNTIVDIDQTGQYGQVIGYAIGDENRITVSQAGVGNQVGSGSLSPIGVTPGIAVIGDGNDVNVSQGGMLNQAFVTIESGSPAAWVNNEVDVTQTSNNNVATVTIDGDGNTATITQD